MNQQSVMNHRGFRCKKNLLPCGIVRIHAEIEGRQILLHSKHHLQRIASHVPIFRKTASCSSMFLWYSMRFPFTCPFTQNFPPTNAHFKPAPSLWARQGRRCEFLQFLGFQLGDRLRVLEPWFFFRVELPKTRILVCWGSTFQGKYTEHQGSRIWSCLLLSCHTSERVTQCFNMFANTSEALAAQCDKMRHASWKTVWRMAISPLSDPRASPGHWPLARQQNRPPCNTCHGRAFHLGTSI